MLKYSKLHPELLFCITGEGEGSDDRWKHYFKNGKSQFCQGEIIYPEYYESQLK